MNLEINTTYGQVGVDSYPGSIKIDSNRDFAMKSKPPEMELKPGKSELRIDREKTNYDLGLKTIRQSFRDFKKKSNEAGLEAIGKIAREGDMLGRIEKNDASIISRLARQNFMDEPFAGNVGLIPEHPPEIEVESRLPETKLKWADIKVIKRKVFSDITGKPGKAEVYLLQKGGVEVSYKGKNMDLQV